MTHYPPQQPGPWDPAQQPAAVPYPAYPPYDAPQYGAPPPYGYPPQGAYAPPQQGLPYPYPYPAPPQPKRNRGWLIGGGIAAVVLVIALVVGGVVLLRSTATPQASKDESEIARLVQDFNAAGSSGKFSDLAQYFCKAEAGMFGALGQLGEILQGIEVPSNAPKTEVTATDIKVKGDVASAHMNAGGPFDTAYFRKESGEWKVCMSAATDFNKKQ
ncbi:Rv0361 family membrane protein [Mycobacterium sp. BMJ-28]